MSLTIEKPNLILTLLEARAPVELAIHTVSFRFYEKNLPQGDGRAVLVIPGFGAGDLSTFVLRRSLKRLNYYPVGWQMGRNMGSTHKNRSHLKAELERLYHLTGKKVSIVGWSLGGIFARELARSYPEYVHSVVSMGSPFNGDPKANVLHDVFHKISKKKFTNEDLEAFNRRRQPPTDIPTISIYSKTDGVVSWQCSLEEESAFTENVEVFSSHCGLGFNPIALAELAKALDRAKVLMQRL